MDSESWRAYSKTDPDLEKLIPHLPPFKLLNEYRDVHDIRKSIKGNSEFMVSVGLVKPADLTGITKQDIQIPTRDGTSIRAIHYRPESGTPGPLLVYYFGGGWTFGWPDAKENWFEILVKELGFVVLAVDYRLAPEHVFPKAAEDAWDSLQWAAKNASSLQADSSKGFIVWGTSAGGNLTAVVSHQAVDEGLSPPLTGIFLEVPLLILPDAVPEKYKPHYNSYEDNKDPVFLKRADLDYFRNCYNPNPKSHLVNTLLWPSGHKGQPPTYMMLCGQDPLRDEGLIYEYVLREECKVPTRMDMYSGYPHFAMDVFPQLPIYEKSAKDLKAGLKWLLSFSS